MGTMLLTSFMVIGSLYSFSMLLSSYCYLVLPLTAGLSPVSSVRSTSLKSSKELQW